MHERERELLVAVDDVLALHADERELERLEPEVDGVVRVLDLLDGPPAARRS